MKKKYKIFLIIISVVVIIIIGLSLPFLLAKHCLLSEISKLRNVGIPVTPQEFAEKYYKPVPENANASKIFEKAFSMLEECSSPSFLIFQGQAKTPWLDQKLNGDLLKYAKKYLEKNNDAFDEIEKATRYKYLRFAYDWNKGLGRKLIPADNIREIIYLYAIQIEIAIYNRNSTMAKQYLKNMFHLNDLIKQEPTMLAQIVSQFCESVIISCLERCINNCHFDSDDLKYFIAKCDEDEKYFCSRWPLTWLNEMVMGADLASPAQVEAIGLFDYKSNDINKRLLSAQYDFISGNMYKTLARELNRAKKIMEMPLFSYSKNIKELRAIASNAQKSKGIGASFSSTSMCDVIYQKLLKIIVRLRCAKTACAIKLYKLKYRAFPKSLKSLVPEFLSSIPLDPFDNNILKYFYDKFTVKYEIPGFSKEKITYSPVILKKNGFCIYSSVGNLKDNMLFPLTRSYFLDGKKIGFIVINNRVH